MGKFQNEIKETSSRKKKKESSVEEPDGKVSSSISSIGAPRHQLITKLCKSHDLDSIQARSAREIDTPPPKK